MTATQRVMPLMVGGEEVLPSSGDVLETLDPATGEIISYLSAAGSDEVDQAVESARRSLESGDDWSLPAHRVQVLTRIASGIRNNSDALTTLESRDTGKPLSQARVDVAVAARYFEFYAGMADKLDGRSIPLGPGYIDYTVREPWGVCGIITPWNYPLQIGAREVAPALAAGNGVLLKPSKEASLSTLELARIAREAGLPNGRLSVLTGPGATTGLLVAQHPGVDYLSFTGSAEVGREVAAIAANMIRPISLELGGKSPNIVFADADLEKALPAILRSILQNAGQTCSAGSRLLVHEAVADTVTNEIAKRMQAVRIGPGLEDPDLGPLISERQREGVRSAVEVASEGGATVVTGGKPPAATELASGFFFEPTLLDDVDSAMAVAVNEVFGPVLAVTRFATDDQAIELANATRYGLVAAIWTQDVGRAHAVARQLQAGQVYVNAYGAGGGVELPFGGYKESGFGRSKGLEGIHEYTRIKNVCVAIQ
jgi:aldehyde dehydrogenase (NAD+)